MQTTTKFGGFIKLIVLLAAIVTVTSCTNTRRYGCPNHLFAAGYNK